MLTTIAVILFFLPFVIWAAYAFSHAPDGLELPGKGFVPKTPDRERFNPPAKTDTAEQPFSSGEGDR